MSVSDTPYVPTAVDETPLSSTSLSRLDANSVRIAHDEGDDAPTAHQIQLGTWAAQVSLFGRGETAGEQLLSLRRALAHAVDLIDDRLFLLRVVECGADSGYRDEGDWMVCQRDDGHQGDHAGHGITWAQGWHAGLTEEPES